MSCTSLTTRLRSLASLVFKLGLLAFGAWAQLARSGYLLAETDVVRLLWRLVVFLLLPLSLWLRWNLKRTPSEPEMGPQNFWACLVGSLLSVRERNMAFKHETSKGSS